MVGITRRLQALLWMGVHPKVISPHTESTEDEVIWTALGAASHVDADRVKQVYRRFVINPPERDDTVASFARLMNWDGPGAWDDIDNPEAVPEITVHPLTTPREMMYDVKTSKGWSNLRISEEFGVSRQVVRDTLLGNRNRLYSSRYNQTREIYLNLLKEGIDA